MRIGESVISAAPVLRGPNLPSIEFSLGAMKTLAFVLLLALSTSWAHPGKKVKRGLLHGGPIASGSLAVGDGHLDIPSVPSLPLENEIHSSEVSSAGFAGASNIGLGAVGGQVLEQGSIAAGLGGGLSGLSGAPGPLGGPDLHSNEAHYHLGHSVQRHVSILHRIGVPVPQPYQVQVERRVPVQVPTPVDVPVDRPYPVHVPRPYEVKVFRDVPVEVDQPIPVPVSVPVHINVPHPVKVVQEVPVPVHIIKKVPVPIPHPIIVKKKVPVAIHAHIEPVHGHAHIEPVHGHAHIESLHGHAHYDAHHGW